MLDLTLRAAISVAVFVGFTALERRRPLRQPRHAANRRLAVNLAVGALAFGLVALLYGLTVAKVVQYADHHELGLLRWLGLPAWLAAPLAIVLLDYTLWVWHWLNHHVPFLWRFHAAHHADLDLDASTAIRFHPGELALSIPYRIVQIVLIGPALAALVAWELLVFVFIVFHHSNLRLPGRADRALSFAIITPRLHGIHHSRRPQELHANFGTLLSTWDVVHRLRAVGVSQDTIDVGLPHQDDPDALGIASSLAVPFHRRPPPRT